MKKHLVVVNTILFSIIYILVAGRIARIGLPQSDEFRAEYVDAKVVALTQRVPAQGAEGEVYISFEALIRSGEKKGQTVQAVQYVDYSLPGQFKEVAAGDGVLLVAAIDGVSDAAWSLAQYKRTDAIIVLAVVFMLCLVLFGRYKGVKTIISLAFTCLAVFVVFIPAVLSGQNVYAWSAITVVFITVMTLLLVSGATKKSLVAGLGCVSGVLAAALLTLVMNGVLRLTGVVDEQSIYLLYLENPVDLNAITFAAIIIGAVGAIMDVAISIASSLNEISITAGADKRTLQTSGLAIGRDVMGTMANTLILAYIGSSLSLVVLLFAYNDSLLFLFNRELIIIELLQALAGSMGILLTIPLTTLIASVLYTKIPAGKAPAGTGA